MGHAIGALLFGAAGAFFLFGTPLGAVAFENALLDAGAFSAYCEHDGHRPCKQQHVLLSQSFQIFAVWGTIAAWPVGALGDRLGPFWLCRLMVLLCAVGFAVCGMNLDEGWPFVVGMSLASIGGSAVNTLALGSIVPLATRGDHRRRDHWTGMVSSAVDIGYMSAVPVGMLLDWHLLPTSAWFTVVACGVVVVFLPWHQLAVMPLAATAELPASPVMARDAPAGTTRGSTLRHLRDCKLWVAVAEFSASLIAVGAVVAAAGRISPYFDLPSRHATAYVPLVIGVSGIVYQVLACVGIAHRQELMLLLRLLFLSGFVLSLALEQFRSPATFWFGIGCASTWRATALVVSTQAGSYIGAGGDEGSVVGMVITLSGFTAFLGQPLVYFIGNSPQNLTACMALVGAVSVIIEYAMFDAIAQLIGNQADAARDAPVAGVTQPSDASAAQETVPLTLASKTASDETAPRGYGAV